MLYDKPDAMMLQNDQQFHSISQPDIPAAIMMPDTSVDA